MSFARATVFCRASLATLLWTTTYALGHGNDAARVKLCGMRFLGVALHWTGAVEKRSTTSLNAELESIGYFTNVRSLARREDHTPRWLSAPDVQAMLERYFPAALGEKGQTHRRIFLAALSREFASGLNELARSAKGKISAVTHGEMVRTVLEEAIDRAVAVTSALAPEGRRNGVDPKVAETLVVPLLHAGVPAPVVRQAFRLSSRQRTAAALEKALLEYQHILLGIADKADGTAFPALRNEFDLGSLKGGPFLPAFQERGTRQATVDRFLTFIAKTRQVDGHSSWREFADAFLRAEVLRIVREGREELAAKAAERGDTPREADDKPRDPSDKAVELAKDFHVFLDGLASSDSSQVSNKAIAKHLGIEDGAIVRNDLIAMPWLVNHSHDKYTHATLRAFQRDVTLGEIREVLQHFRQTPFPIAGVVSWHHQAATATRNEGLIVEGRVASGKLVQLMLRPSSNGWRIVTVMRRSDNAVAGGAEPRNEETNQQRQDRQLAAIHELAKVHATTPAAVSAEAQADLKKLGIDMPTALAPIVANTLHTMPDGGPFYFFQPGASSSFLRDGRYIYVYRDKATGLYVQASVNDSGDAPTLRIERVLSER